MAKLNLSERLYALNILNQFKGNTETLVDVLEDVKNLSIEEAEWEMAERKINNFVGEDGKPGTTWAWNDEKGGEKEIEFKKKTSEYLKAKIEEMDKAGEFTFQDKAVITLKEKL
jgi:hypothetical protein